MSPVVERHMKPSDDIHKRIVTMFVDSVGNSETDTLFDQLTPGYQFEILGVEVFAEAVTATASCDVKIGGTTALSGAITPSAGAVVAGTLAATKAAVRGTATDTLDLHVTTNGTGALTGLKVRVTIRKFPLGGGDDPSVT